jgi:hypothetical protein
MYFLRASLSVTVLSFFLSATYAQDYDPESSIIPTTTAPPYTTIINQPPCVFTMNGIVFDTCFEASHPAELSESQPPHITHTFFQPRCLVTINGHVFDTCSVFTSTIGDSKMTVAPRKSTTKLPGAVNCYTTTHGRIIDTCLREALSTHATYLTTLTAHKGDIVVVNYGDGFESGHPPTMTLTSPRPTKPTTVCIKNRCYDVIGTFGSPASATAKPTQTRSKDEL